VSPTPEERAWSNGTVELRIGDCFRKVPVGEGDPFDAEIVSCSSPHDGEVVPGGCGLLMEGLASDVKQEGVAAVTQYVGMKEESSEALSDWLADNGLTIYANWSVTAQPQCAPFLAAEEGDLTRSYRATNAE
jgi:predicted RNA-binding protein with TRAM domain